MSIVHYNRYVFFVFWVGVWFCLKPNGQFRRFGWRLWSSEVLVLPPPHSCSCKVVTWGHSCLLAFLKREQNCRKCSGDCGPVLLLRRGDRTVEPVLGTVVLSGMGSLQYVPALVCKQVIWRFTLSQPLWLYQGDDFGPVWLGKYSVCVSPSHVPRLWSFQAWEIFSIC